GGGGNFGIVTSFEYRLHPVGPIVLAGPIFHPLEDAPGGLAFYRGFTAPALPAPEPPREADRDGRRLLRRSARRRHRSRPAAEGVRQPDRRPARAQALPGAAVDVRPTSAARLAPLPEVGGATPAH